VSHPARRSLGELAKKAKRLQAGETQLRRLRGEPAGGLRALRYMVPPVPSILRGLPKVSPPTARSKLSYASFVLVLHYVRVYHRLRGLLSPGTPTV
jgi:hypothetical protein